MSRANEPAYPIAALDEEVGEAGGRMRHLTREKAGMTLREYYAGLAMQGLRAGESIGERWMSKGLAAQAVKDADALLAELAKPRETPLDERGHPVTA